MMCYTILKADFLYGRRPVYSLYQIYFQKIQAFHFILIPNGFPESRGANVMSGVVSFMQVETTLFLEIPLGRKTNKEDTT